MSPEEIEAAGEIENIDSLVREASETIKRLRERRAEILPLAEHTPRRIASLLHWQSCLNGHFDHSNCTWRREQPRVWSTGARDTWLQRAKARLADKDPDEFLHALLTISSASHLHEYAKDFPEDDS